jgi:transcriptional regulator with XRE-family HTH domain
MLADPTSAWLTLSSPSATMVSVDDFYRGFGARVRAARKEKELTQQQLGRSIGLNRTSITNIEAGTQHVPLHYLPLIANALDCEPQTLLPSEVTLTELVPRELLDGLKRSEQAWIRDVVSRGVQERSKR